MLRDRAQIPMDEFKVYLENTAQEIKDTWETNKEFLAGWKGILNPVFDAVSAIIGAVNPLFDLLKP